jgi:hypothetical protein
MSRRLPGKLVLGLVAALVAVELALHLAPGLLPRAYRARFPMLGVEFFHPGILERTPIEGLPLPLPSSAHRGPPPADLVEFGVAPADAGADARAYPAVELDCDALGFPNERVLEQADLVLVGDSFGVAAGVRVPRGLQLGLAEATRLVVYNASVAGIGPVQERWLVEHVALARKPRAVLWLFFSGNDLTASYEPYLHRREGRTTWAEAYADRRKPTLYLVDLLRWRFAGHGTPPCPSPLPAFAFPLAHGTRASLWLHPDYLRQLAWTRAQWEEHPVWAVVKDDLRAAREACRAAGSRLVLVYLPSTPGGAPAPARARSRARAAHRGRDSGPKSRPRSRTSSTSSCSRIVTRSRRRRAVLRERGDPVLLRDGRARSPGRARRARLPHDGHALESRGSDRGGRAAGRVSCARRASPSRARRAA